MLMKYHYFNDSKDLQAFNRLKNDNKVKIMFQHPKFKLYYSGLTN